MDYTLSLTRHASATLMTHLLKDRSCEQMAITLCGVNRLHRELRLLVRDVILLPQDAFRCQTATQLELKPEVQTFIHRRAHARHLIQVDWHSHLGAIPGVTFSGTDDHYERAQAAYLAERMDGIPYGSVVVNEKGLDARLWVTGKDAASSTKPEKKARPQAQPLRTVSVGDLQRCLPTASAREGAGFVSPIYDRQVRAFGQAFQQRMGELRVGIVGVGGLGSALVEHLARLGVRAWVLVDPDTVALSNLNRLVNASISDAQKARPKVNVARSSIRQVSPRAYVRAMQTDVFDPQAQRALKSCDLLIAATDNHSSRMALNRLAVQYLIPLLHVGFNISVEQHDSGTQVTDVSGEFAFPELGRWCLQCAGLIDAQRAGWELASPEQRAILRQRGYVADTPAPAVHHLDGVVAALAAAEIHNFVHIYKPQQRYLVYDARKSELLPLHVTPSQACPVCDPEHGVLGLGDLEPLPDYQRAHQVELPPPPKDKPRAAPKSSAPKASLQRVTPLPSGIPLPQSRHREREQPLAAKLDPEWQ